jgi:ABC-type transporter Mla MlaB component
MSTVHDATPSDARARFHMERKPRALRLVAEGEWTTKDAAKRDIQLRAIQLGDAAEAEIDGSGLERIDSAGTWLLVRTKREWEGMGKRVGPILLPGHFDVGDDARRLLGEHRTRHEQQEQQT